MLSHGLKLTEHLTGKQGQDRGAQMYAMHLSDWILVPPLPRLHWSVGSGGEGMLPADPCLPEVFWRYVSAFIYSHILCCHIWANAHSLLPGILLYCCHCCALHCITLGKPGRYDSSVLRMDYLKRLMHWVVTGTPSTLEEELSGEASGFLGSLWLNAVPIIEEWGPIRDDGPITESSTKMAELLK